MVGSRKERRERVVGELRFRPYELAAAPEVVTLWNRAAGEGYPLRERVLRQIVDLNPKL